MTEDGNHQEREIVDSTEVNIQGILSIQVAKYIKNAFTKETRRKLNHNIQHDPRKKKIFNMIRVTPTA